MAIEGRETMSAAFRYLAYRPGEGQRVTLLELVTAIGESTADDREVVDTVLHLLETGRVRLCGNFRGSKVDDLR
jgi:hypothetical protein